MKLTSRFASLTRAAYPFAVALLAGVAPATARAEHPSEENARVAGFSAAALARVDSMLERAVADGTTPGAALAIGRAGHLVRLRGYGHTDWDANSPLVTDSTLYDLASLTKVIGTTTLALQLGQSGALNLNDLVSQHLSFWPTNGKHGRLRVRHLLQHTSGLPVGVELWSRGSSREQRIASLARLPMKHEPGARREYSDVGLILLGAIVEQAGGAALDVLLQQRVVARLGLTETMFNPLGTIALARIAPTEFNVRRNHLIHGRAHDDNAMALDGVAGHAGLFSSVRDLALFASALLDAAHARPSALFDDHTFPAALNTRAFGRPLGWDVPTGKSSSGEYFSAASFGHTGFTGTSIWIDPDQDLFVVLLTNRLNPTAANQKHVALRREVHDAVQLAVADPPPPWQSLQRAIVVALPPLTVTASVAPTSPRATCVIAGMLLLTAAAATTRRRLAR